MKYGSDKEVQAVTFNLKEQRMLEKTDSTLKLEKDYALKLIELSSREVKIHQRWLKAKVGRIKSHLTIDEIKEFRQQELQGKFKPAINTVKVSGAFTISAAARRLRLKTERKMAAHGLMPDGSPAPSQRQLYQRQQSNRLSRSLPARSRLSSCETDPPYTPQSTTRSTFNFRDSHDDLETIPETPKTRRCQTAPIREEQEANDHGGGGSGGPRARPATAAVSGRSGGGSGLRREKMHSPPPLRSKSSMGYSSHEVIEKEDRERARSLSTAGAAHLVTRRHSLQSDGSIDGALVKGRREERRQTLLDVEQLQTLRLLDRKRDFLDRVNKWVRENPTNQDQAQMQKLMAALGSDGNAPAASKPAASTATATGTSGTSKQDCRGERPRRMGRTSSFHGKVAFRKRQEGPVEVHWKDLNKCRYLRVADDELDLSGVVTLAKDQVRTLQTLRPCDIEDYRDDD